MATPACTLITEMLWVSESCNSRAIRNRSSPARRRAVSSRVRSASAARSSAARTAASRCRDTSAVTPAATIHPRGNRRSMTSRSVSPAAGLAVSMPTTRADPVTATVRARRPARTAVYTATSTGTAATSG
jgi:hypothetical protein